MWIAKNSVTGKTYGKKYSSVYDCQSFIDKHLSLLEYEMRRAFALENEFIEDFELSKKSKGHVIEDIYVRFQTAIEAFSNDFLDSELVKLEFEKCMTQKKYHREIDDKINKYVRTNWLKYNIIRCYETSQERFADGFDF